MRRNPLKYQAITCFCISAAISLPVFFLYSRIDPQLSFLVMVYAVTSILFLAIGILFLTIYLKRKTGLARELNSSMMEAQEYINEDITGREYTVLGRPKWVAFVFFSWLILFAVYFISTILKSRIIGGSLMAHFNAYSIIMFGAMVAGMFLYWRRNPNGFIILSAVCFFSLFRIVAMMRYFELLIWIYPIISLFVVKKYF